MALGKNWEIGMKGCPTLSNQQRYAAAAIIQGVIRLS